MLDLPRILIVDAQPGTGTDIMQSMRRFGFQVDLTSDGSEALDRFNSIKYSMVIFDDQVPGIGGTEMLTGALGVAENPGTHCA